MSRVYFHMLDGTVEVHGSERHRAAQLVEGLGAVILSRYVEELGVDRAFERPGMLRAYFSSLDKPITVAGHGVHGWSSRGLGKGRGRPRRFGRGGWGFFGGRVYGGLGPGSRDLLLNTALDTGNEAICFLTKFHAQCEIHAWVAGKDRAWLAGVIEKAIENKLVRPEVPGVDPSKPFSTGWRELVGALRRTDVHPVVMSYSVTQQFPHSSFWRGDADNPVPNDRDERAEAFEGYSREKQWALCMPSILDMQMTPENLCTYGFGDGMSALGLAEILDNARREKSP